MKKFIIKRLVQLIPIIIGITLLSFLLVNVSNTDAIDMLEANRGTTISEEQKNELREELGLDQPVIVRYVVWLKGVITGNMGNSYISGKPVFATFISKLPATIYLCVVSILLTLIISLPLGIVAAVNKNRCIDYIIRLLSFLGNSMPNFFAAIMLIYIFALKLNLLPVMGMNAGIKSVILPAVTLAIAMSSRYIRQIRTAVINELQKDYVQGAIARGVGRLKIITGSVLKSSLLTIITLLALSIGSLLGGTAAGVKCVILAPTTMLTPQGVRIKTDMRDAYMIAQCLSYGGYHAVYIPTEADDSVKEYLRMRNDHKLALKKIKQQINAFCIRHGFCYDGTKWTLAHLNWLKKLEITNELYRETLDEYMASYEEQEAKIERYDKRIEEIAEQTKYYDKVKKMKCFLGIKTHTALSLIVETGEFERFAKGNQYASYLGLAPGENSSSDSIHRLGITKAGNSHLRQLLIEASSGICKGAVGHKSKELRARQNGNTAEVIAYADKANTRLRSRYYKFIRHGKKRNVAVAAIARELACFVLGMMTDNIEMKAA